MVGKVDWARLSDEACFESLKVAPKVYGPWSRMGDGDNDQAFVRPTPDGSPSLVMVKRIMGTWHGYVGKSISLPPAFASYEAAMELVDKLLRHQGIRLVGPSRPIKAATSPPPQSHVRERPTAPSAPRALSLAAASTPGNGRSR